MRSLFHIITPPTPCSYLPGQRATMEYEQVLALSSHEYQERLDGGWRHFGQILFRPRCTACRECQSLRVLVDRFQPNRSQRRNQALNEKTVRLQIGLPEVTAEKLALYDRYHAYQAQAKGWPEHPPGHEDSYADAYVYNPLPVEEWQYFIGDRLIGVGYVDLLPKGLSAIYFFYDPAERARGLGTWNILNLLKEAREKRTPYVYLGYFVAGCSSLAYKACFRPHERRGPDGQWREYLMRCVP